MSRLLGASPWLSSRSQIWQTRRKTTRRMNSRQVERPCFLKALHRRQTLGGEESIHPLLESRGLSGLDYCNRGGKAAMHIVDLRSSRSLGQLGGNGWPI